MSSPVESTRSSSSSVARLYKDIWKVKFRKDSLSASMFSQGAPRSRTWGRTCVVASPRQSVRVQGSGFPLKSHGTCFICLVLCSSTYAQTGTFLSEALLGSFSHPQTLTAHMLNTHKGGNITAATKTPRQTSLYCPLVARLKSNCFPGFPRFPSNWHERRPDPWKTGSKLNWATCDKCGFT